MLGQLYILHFPFLSQKASVASRVATCTLCSTPADGVFLQAEEISEEEADQSRPADHPKEPPKQRPRRWTTSSQDEKWIAPPPEKVALAHPLAHRREQPHPAMEAHRKKPQHRSDDALLG